MATGFLHVLLSGNCTLLAKVLTFIGAIMWWEAQCSAIASALAAVLIPWLTLPALLTCQTQEMVER